MNNKGQPVDRNASLTRWQKRADNFNMLGVR